MPPTAATGAIPICQIHQKYIFLQRFSLNFGEKRKRFEKMRTEAETAATAGPQPAAHIAGMSAMVFVLSILI